MAMATLYTLGMTTWRTAPKGRSAERGGRKMRRIAGAGWQLSGRAGGAETEGAHEFGGCGGFGGQGGGCAGEQVSTQAADLADDDGGGRAQGGRGGQGGDAGQGAGEDAVGGEGAVLDDGGGGCGRLAVLEEEGGDRGEVGGAHEDDEGVEAREG